MLGYRRLLFILRPVNMHAPKLSFDPPDPLLLLVRFSVPEDQIHIFESFPASLRDEEVCEEEGE